MKLARLIEQEEAFSTALQHQMALEKHQLTPFPDKHRDSAPAGAVTRYEVRARRYLSRTRQLVLSRLKVRQRLARTLAVHPDVTDLLAERQVARLRVSVLRELRDAMKKHYRSSIPETREAVLLTNSRREDRIRYAEEYNPFDRLFFPDRPFKPPPETTWLNVRRQEIVPTLALEAVLHRLRVARKRLDTLEQQMDHLCSTYEAER